MMDLFRSSWGFERLYAVMVAASSIDAQSAVIAVVVALVLAVVVAVGCQIAAIAQGPLLAALTFLLVVVLLLLL